MFQVDLSNGRRMSTPMPAANSRKTKVLVTAVTAALTCMIVLLVAAIRPSAPVSQGKPLSYWLRELDSEYYDKIEEGRRAFRGLGPEAVPFLIEKAQGEALFRTRTYCDMYPYLPAFVQRHIPKPRPIEWMLHWPIAIALRELGTDALPEMCRASADSDWTIRYIVDYAVKQNARKADSAVVPGLVSLSKDPNSRIRGEAAGQIGDDV
jgi:hypothetical protein